MSTGMVTPEARMANDIARHFKHLPNEVAVDAVARHIETFWDPAMRERLRSQALAHDDSLDPQVTAAAKVLKRKPHRQETQAQP